MKINVTVDLSDFYTEEEGQSFSEEIKLHIAHTVKSQVWADFQSKALDEVKSLVNSEFEKSQKMNINYIVSEIFSTEKLKESDGKHGQELVTVKDYIQRKIKKTYFSENNNADYVLRRYIEDFSKKFDQDLKKSSETISKEIKDRYDLMFASQIVTKLNEQGMLKDDVGKILLG